MHHLLSRSNLTLRQLMLLVIDWTVGTESTNAVGLVNFSRQYDYNNHYPLLLREQLLRLVKLRYIKMYNGGRKGKDAGWVSNIYLTI